MSAAARPASALAQPQGETDPLEATLWAEYEEATICYSEGDAMINARMRYGNTRTTVLLWWCEHEGILQWIKWPAQEHTQPSPSCCGREREGVIHTMTKPAVQEEAHPDEATGPPNPNVMVLWLRLWPRRGALPVTVCRQKNFPKL